MLFLFTGEKNDWKVVVGVFINVGARVLILRVQVLEHMVFLICGEVSDGVSVGLDGALGAEVSIGRFMLLGASNKVVYFFR